MSLIISDSKSTIIESSEQIRSIIPPESLGIAAVCSVDEKTATKVKQLTGNVLESIMDFKDVECDPNVKKMMEGHLNANKISNQTSYSNYKEESKMINTASSYMQEISEKAEFYHMEIMFQSYFDKYRMFCNVLKDYNKNLIKSKNKDDLKKHFRTLQFSFNKLIKDPYIDAKLLMKEREELEPKSFKKKIWASKWGFLKYIWKVKYNLYFLGILVYNTYEYVYLPGEITSYLNLLLRIVGTICYTFTDPIMSAQLIQVFLNAISKIVNVTLICTGLDSIQKIVPDKLKNAYKGVEAFFSYIFLYFSLDFTRYIVSTCCQIMLIIAASYRGGFGMVSNNVWEHIVKSGELIGKSMSNAYVFIADSIVEAGINISEALSLIFIDVLGNSIIIPISRFIQTNILNKLPDIITPLTFFAKVFSGGAYGKTDGSDSTELMIYNNEKENLALAQKADAEQVMVFIEKYFNGEDNTLSLSISEAKRKFLPKMTEALDYIRNDIIEEWPNLKQNIEKTILQNYRDIMKKQGTYELYNATFNYSNLTGISNTVVVFLFLIIALFTYFIG
jgi:hypothetical protein